MLSTKDAGERLDMTSRAVVLLINKGIITATRYGRDWFIDPAEVERYRAERKPRGRPKKQ